MTLIKTNKRAEIQNYINSPRKSKKTAPENLATIDFAAVLK